jgi:hypothetical protein
MCFEYRCTEFLIADTFTDSLARLTGDEQEAVKTTAFDLQLDPAKRAGKAPLFANMADDVLLGYGVPAEWLGDVRRATEDTRLSLADPRS